MSTREFAKQTGRQHGNVMTTVRGMIARGELNIPESTWIGDNGKALPEFRLSRFDFEKMAYRLKSSDMEVVRRHFGVREMKIEPAPVLVPIGTVTPAAAKAVVTPKESIPATLKLVPPVGAIFLPESPVVVSNVVPFNFGDVSIRVVMQGGEPWWVASDVCGALEIGNSRMAMSRLDDDEKGVTTADTLGGKQELGVVNESGLYSLILKSRKPSAKRFKKWVTSEVLPTIRKTGTFSTAPQFTVPTTFADALRLAGELEEQRVALTHQVETQVLKITEDAPKVEFYDNVAVAVGTQTVQEVAKEFGIGSTKFYKLLRDEKILMSHPNQNVPYQKHMDAGHFEVVVGEWKNQETGEIKLKPRSFVTAKGLIYLERRLNKLGHFRTTQVAA